jgi:hypothetical protein
MKVNKFYLLKVWLVITFLTALVYACWPDLRLYADKVGPESLTYKTGMFFGVLVGELKFSAIIFICLWLLFFLMTAKFYSSDLIVKSVFFVFFLIGTLIANHIYFHGHGYIHSLNFI